VFEPRTVPPVAVIITTELSLLRKSKRWKILPLSKSEKEKYMALKKSMEFTNMIQMTTHVILYSKTAKNQIYASFFLVALPQVRHWQHSIHPLSAQCQPATRRRYQLYTRPSDVTNHEYPHYSVRPECINNLVRTACLQSCKRIFHYVILVCSSGGHTTLLK
jgi:hypothetical protein